MVPEGTQRKDLNKIRSAAGDTKTSGVTAVNKLKEVYGSKYCISLDHEILAHHGVFYLQVLYNDLVFEITLAQAFQAVKGSDPAKLKYKLTNIHLEYKMIHSKHKKRTAFTPVAKSLPMTI